MGPAAAPAAAPRRADGRSAPQEAQEPRGGAERPGQEEGADGGAGAAGGGAGAAGEGRGAAGRGAAAPHRIALPHGSLQNQQLLLENQLLREKTGNLALENQELRCRLGLDALETAEESEPKPEVSLPASGQPWLRAVLLREGVTPAWELWGWDCCAAGSSSSSARSSLVLPMEAFLQTEQIPSLERAPLVAREGERANSKLS